MLQFVDFVSDDASPLLACFLLDRQSGIDFEEANVDLSGSGASLGSYCLFGVSDRLEAIPRQSNKTSLQNGEFSELYRLQNVLLRFFNDSPAIDHNFANKPKTALCGALTRFKVKCV